MSKQARSKQLFTALSLGLGLTLALLWMWGAKPTMVVQAADFTVTKFTDTNDGVCDADCSLREAILAANASGDLDVITLMAGIYTLAITGTGEDAAATGDLDLTTSVTIIGLGSDQTIVDGGALDRVFDIRSGTVVISGLTIRNGDAGGFIFGGGLLNEADLTLMDSAVISNTANSGGGIANQGDGVILVTNTAISTNTSGSNGAGIANFGKITLADSSISNNIANSGGGGIYNSGGVLTVTNSTIYSNMATLGGGGIASSSSSVLSLIRSSVRGNTGGGISNTDSNLTVTNSAILSNTAGFGSGIINANGVVALMGSTIRSNTGGGIFSSADSDLIVTQSTISHNTGDGISNSKSNLTVTNSTVSYNSDSSGSGIANFSGGVVTVTNSTISSNTFSILGSGINNFSGTVTLKNTIVANNTTEDCQGAMTSGGYNLDRDATCNLNAVGDLADTNPILGPLQMNGGETETHALLPDSPAIDAAGNVTCPATDQRGLPRPLDGDLNGTAICDMGAYEFGFTIYLPVIAAGS